MYIYIYASSIHSFTPGSYRFLISEIFVINNGNTSQPKVLEETISFNTNGANSSTQLAVVNIKFTNRKAAKAGRGHRRLRKHCCNAGQLAAKHGLSCLIPRNFRNMFFNLITPARQKYQSTVSSRIRRRFRSKAIYRVYRQINVCVKRSKKRIVQKCCLGYKSRQRSHLRRN